jgi:glycosyltransferase involved in cell wall biosynthesis
MSKKRIAIIYTHLPHYRVPVFRALIESECFEYNFFYDPRGIDTTILSGSLGRGVYPIRTIKIGPLVFQPAIFKLAFFSTYDAFILLGNPYIVTNWFGALIMRMRKKKVLMWTHGWIRSNEGAKGVARLIFYKLADALLLYGERGRDIALNKGILENNIHVIYNSLDYGFQKKIRDNLDVSIPRERFFLFVGRITKEVRLEIAIRALSILRLNQVNAKMIIVGDGEEQVNLRRLAQDLQLNIEFSHAIYDEAVLASLFLKTTAVVSPGKVGLLAVHALTYGAPVITSGNFEQQMPEAEAIIDGVTGSLCGELSPESFADAMREWLSLAKVEAAKKVAIATVERCYTPEHQRYCIEKALLNFFRD